MRSNLENNRASKVTIGSARFGVVRPEQLSANYTIPEDAPFFHFLDPGASDRDVILPALREGAAYGISHVGAASNLVVKNAAGSEIVTLSNVQGAIFVCSGTEWKYFTNTSSDLLDTTEISSPLGSIDVVVNAGAIELEVDPANVDHDSLSGFVANEHVDHSAVDVGTAANSGLSGGGDITASRALALDVDNLATITPVLADEFPFYDVGGAATGKATLTTLNGILDHDALLNFVANEHVDHSAVSIQAGEGLTGGGDLTTTRTLDIDLTGLPADTPVAADEIMFHDVGGGDLNKVTLTNLMSALGLLPSIDEDDMSSNSAAHVPTQQSVKSYINSFGLGGQGGHASVIFTDFDVMETAGFFRTGASPQNGPSGVNALTLLVVPYSAAYTGQFAFDVASGGGAAGNVYSRVQTNTVWGSWRKLLQDADIGTSGAKVPLLNAANTWGATQNFADNILQRPTLLDYGETVNAIGSAGGGTQDIDLTLGNVVTATVDTSETTFTFSNPSASGKCCSFTLILTNGGSQTVNWPASVNWAGGNEPTLTAAGVDILTFITVDGGTTWYGFAAGIDMQ